MNDEIHIGNVFPSIIDPNEHWFLGDGCLEQKTAALFPDGHGWKDSLPEGERQNKNNFESNNCTNYSLLNCVEAIGRKKFGAAFQNNLSERERGIRSGTSQGGNTLHNVSESLRAQGAIPEVFLPFDDSITTWQQYYSPNPLPFDLWKVAESWHRKYDYNHDWAFLKTDPLEVRKTKMKEALKYSPVSVSGYAWSRHPDGLYYHDGTYDNHAFEIWDYEEGKYWLALDSYPDETGSFLKKLDWNFAFGEAKRHSLEKKLGGETAPEPTKSEYYVYLVKWFISDIFKAK